MQVNNSINTQNIYANKPQSQVAFKATPDLDALKAKQDEFRRMSDQTGDSGLMGKLGKFATKAIGVVIAFTAMKVVLGKASDMITSTLGKASDKVIEKTTEKYAEKAATMTTWVDKIKNSKIDQYAINIIASGAAVGVAMKDFGLVKKPVSDSTEDLVDNAVDNAQGNSYNNYTDFNDSSEFDDHDHEHL